MAKNVPPAHFGYMASGIDDEQTLRANREGFQKFVLRPRRLVDVSKPDTSVELFGHNYATPGRSSARPAATGPFTPTAKSPSPKRRQGRQSSDDPVQPGYNLGRGRHQGARRADLVPALRHQQVRHRGPPCAARRARRLRGGGGDGRPQRRPQSRKPERGCSAPTPGNATTATTVRASPPTSRTGRPTRVSI